MHWPERDVRQPDTLIIVLLSLLLCMTAYVNVYIYIYILHMCIHIYIYIMNRAWLCHEYMGTPEAAK